MKPWDWIVAACDFVIAAGSAVSGAMVQSGVVVLPSRGVFVLALAAGLTGAAIHIKSVFRRANSASS